MVRRRRGHRFPEDPGIRRHREPCSGGGLRPGALGAGAIFGVVEGAALVFVAAVLGSTAAFLVARYVARSAVERRVASEPRFAAIDRAVGEQGRKIVLLLRLSPVFPFNLLNYGLGLTKVRLLDYVVASIGMIPGTLLYVYSGKVAGDVAAAAGGVAMERGASAAAPVAPIPRKKRRESSACSARN